MVSINDVLKASKGLPVDDIFAELWGRKLSSDYTIAVYTGTLPAVLAGTKAGYLHHYKIYGNLTQNGTPTPSDPILPSECGERTENRFDISMVEQGGWTIVVGTTPIKTEPGDRYHNIRTRYNKIVPLSLFATTLSLYCPSNIKINYAWVGANGRSLGGSGWQRNGDTATAPEQAVSMTFILGLEGDVQCTPSDFYDINIVADSTPPESYIPFGYKLPLLSGSTPVDIYLGESQTTRRIKKLVLKGTENWGFNIVHVAYLAMPDTFLGEGVSIVSTHYTAVSNKTTYNQISDKQCCLRADGHYIWIRDEGYSTAEDFKAYLAQQYANGTPVTVWYILAEPETGTLNEPLRKIGDYADTIDSTQTSAQIPTTANSTTISWAGSGLAPSEVELTYERK